MRRVLLLVAVATSLMGTAVAQTRPATPAATPASAQIDLNAASRDELMTLEGIGEVRADAIIRARPFKAKTELVERRLIPEALYDRIADKVMARAPAATTPPRGTPPAQQQRR